jgi:ABC-type spermidine/putrescine transport system permease subunit II
MDDLLSLFTTTESIDILELGIDLVLAAIMAAFVRIVFVRFGNTLSNRKQFGRIFFLVSVCTTLIIAVIKSSIALSLGLVGALSIVRFRAAIKEPEELAYLFLCVAIGLGFGAGFVL